MGPEKHGMGQMFDQMFVRCYIGQMFFLRFYNHSTTVQSAGAGVAWGCSAGWDMGAAWPPAPVCSLWGAPCAASLARHVCEMFYLRLCVK